ncbi:Scr1 family TA system antitoxin-like transcriptional regulator [Sphaerisporangium aureirubrum]|uniref:Scr1 family TA system antitoxin-like transcriptional regulator n=1 Tax=Sphaerisporangium aureirubrum TaxID=1544736 RepID=A0ABW1NN29_9ACTN
MPLPNELHPADSPRALFGFELRKHREAAGLTQRELADKIQYTNVMISAVENAKRTPSLDFAERCDAALHLDGALVRLWPFIHHSATPTWFRPWLDLEREATVLRTWEPLVVPGLLQTEEYARTIFQGEPRPVPERVEEQVMARMERQLIFERAEPPMFWALLDEGVLHRVIGNHHIMNEQLKRLEELSFLPHITIQVVPFSARATAGLEGGFVLAQTPGAADTVYIEAVGHGHLLERDEDVRKIATRYEVIRAEALPRQASLDLIREIRYRMNPQLEQELAVATWRKSSRSGGSGGNCVEIASLADGHKGVRDSKNPTGPAFVVGAGAWEAFRAGVEDGTLA